MCQVLAATATAPANLEQNYTLDPKPHLGVLTVAVQGAVPLLTSQQAVQIAWCTAECVVHPH